MKALSIPDVLAEVAVLVKPHFGKGRPADYIPSLAAVPGGKFGMAVRTVDGGEHVIGDADEGFSVQSITKVFALGLALNRIGDEIWTRVGKEPSGTPFNHLSLLEAEDGVPRNPFINAGAMAVVDVLMKVTKDVRSEERFSRNAETDLVCRLLLAESETRRDEMAAALTL